MRGNIKRRSEQGIFSALDLGIKLTDPRRDLGPSRGCFLECTPTGRGSLSPNPQVPTESPGRQRPKPPAATAAGLSLFLLRLAASTAALKEFQQVAAAAPNPIAVHVTVIQICISLMIEPWKQK
jgi:hypothetical protein